MPLRITTVDVHRDGSACATLKRVPKPGVPVGQLVDEWVDYHVSESERDAFIDPKSLSELPLRQKQVTLFIA